MRKQRRLLLPVVFLILLMWLGFGMIPRQGQRASQEGSATHPMDASQETATTDAASAASQGTTASASKLSAAVKEEFERVGSLDEDPEASARRMDVLAERLKTPERKELRRMALDPFSDGDERAVAVELLARSSSEEAVPLLESIASDPPPKLQDSRQSSFEQVLRARAIEGLGEHPSPSAVASLRRVAGRTEDAFLLDRTRRALAAREAHVPAPEKQDEDALRRLLR
jgi:hypothetical protein